jgi:hypothetical protein
LLGGRRNHGQAIHAVRLTVVIFDRDLRLTIGQQISESAVAARAIEVPAN